MRHRSARRPVGSCLLKSRAAQRTGQHRSGGAGGRSLVVAGTVLTAALVTGLAVRGALVGADGKADDDGAVPGRPGASAHGSASRGRPDLSGRHRSGAPQVRASTAVGRSPLTSPAPAMDTRPDDAGPHLSAGPEPGGVGPSTGPTAGPTPTASQEPTPTPSDDPEDEPSEEPSVLPPLPQPRDHVAI